MEPVGVLSFGTGEVGSGGGRSGMSLVMLNRALSPELSRVFNSMKHSYEEHIVCVSMMWSAFTLSKYPPPVPNQGRISPCGE